MILVRDAKVHLKSLSMMIPSVVYFILRETFDFRLSKFLATKDCALQ